MLSQRLTIALVAGEPSGDLLGAGLIYALKSRYPDARFVGIGGPKMIAAGLTSWFPMEILSVNGLVEVLKHYPAIARMRRQLIHQLALARPAIFIGIDAPDFNLDLETLLKRQGVLTVHYTSPTIWAWRKERIRKIAKACDLMLVLFPFETALYEAAGIRACYVGHLLADQIPNEPDTEGARKALQLGSAQPIIALLPGSRNSEVSRHARLFLQTAQRLQTHYPNAVFLVPAATQTARQIFEETLSALNTEGLCLKILDGHTREILQAADVVITASGTATLETALWKKPMVIVYRMATLTWHIAKRLVRLTHVGLPNILCGKEVVPEFLQNDATVEHIGNAVSDWLDHPEKVARLEHTFQALHDQLRQNASETAANAIAALIGEKGNR